MAEIIMFKKKTFFLVSQTFMQKSEAETNCILVISVLQARDHALLVSHRHPNGNVSYTYIVFFFVIFLCFRGQAHFNVVNGARKGQPWGMFTCDRSVPNGRNGPLYEEPEDIEHEFATKVSSVNDPAKAVLIGRLRFKPDSLDPTTSK